MLKQKLVEIEWNQERKCFVRRDTKRKINPSPVGPIVCKQACVLSLDDIASEAKKYCLNSVGFEVVETAHDVLKFEYAPIENVYAFRLYKI